MMRMNLNIDTTKDTMLRCKNFNNNTIVDIAACDIYVAGYYCHRDDTERIRQAEYSDVDGICGGPETVGGVVTYEATKKIPTNYPLVEVIGDYPKSICGKYGVLWVNREQLVTLRGQSIVLRPLTCGFIHFQAWTFPANWYMIMESMSFCVQLEPRMNDYPTDVSRMPELGDLSTGSKSVLTGVVLVDEHLEMVRDGYYRTFKKVPDITDLVHKYNLVLECVDKNPFLDVASMRDYIPRLFVSDKELKLILDGSSVFEVTPGKLKLYYVVNGVTRLRGEPLIINTMEEPYERRCFDCLGQVMSGIRVVNAFRCFDAGKCLEDDGHVAGVRYDGCIAYGSGETLLDAICAAVTYICHPLCKQGVRNVGKHLVSYMLGCTTPVGEYMNIDACKEFLMLAALKIDPMRMLDHRNSLMDGTSVCSSGKFFYHDGDSIVSLFRTGYAIMLVRAFNCGLIEELYGPVSANNFYSLIRYTRVLAIFVNTCMSLMKTVVGLGCESMEAKLIRMDNYVGYSMDIQEVIDIYKLVPGRHSRFGSHFELDEFQVNYFGVMAKIMTETWSFPKMKLVEVRFHGRTAKTLVKQRVCCGDLVKLCCMLFGLDKCKSITLVYENGRTHEYVDSSSRGCSTCRVPNVFCLICIIVCETLGASKITSRVLE